MRAAGCCRLGGAAGVAGVCRGTGEDSGSLPTKCSTKRIGCISLSPSLGADPARWHLSPQGGQPPVPRCPTPLDLTAASAYNRRLYPSPSFPVHPQVRLTSPPLPQPMFFSLVSLPPPIWLQPGVDEPAACCCCWEPDPATTIAYPPSLLNQCLTEKWKLCKWCSFHTTYSGW